MATDNSNYRLATLTAAIAGVFSLIVCALLLYDYSRRDYVNPSENPYFLTLKSALAKQPDDADLKKQIRNMDQQLRREYFRQRVFTVVGAGLLLGGLTIFLLSIKTASALHRKIYYPQPVATPLDLESQRSHLGRWAVAILALTLAGLAIVLSIIVQLDIPSIQKDTELADAKQTENNPKIKTAQSESPKALPETLPTDEEIAKTWPSFRGPAGSGTSAYTNIPTEWDATSDKNIRWKTPVPLPGNNSPIVWKHRVFLTGANENSREVYCFDAASGKILWQKKSSGTPQSTAKAPKVQEDTGYAASTAATDGRRVYAIFANGDLSAFDFNGNLAWSKNLGMPDNAYGHASSLTTYKNTLIVQFDQGKSAAEAKSKLLAFDSATGKPLWQTNRPVRNSWPSPIVIRAADRDQIITAAAPWVIAYDPTNGQDIWRAKCYSPTQDIGPSPTFAAEKIFVANDSEALSAIKADGQGDVTDSHILWKGEDGLPDTCSPLACKEFVFLLYYETLTCYDAENGDMLWSEDLPEKCTSSPSMVGKLVYVFGENGKAWILEPARDKPKRIAECNLGEPCVTSPAFQDGCFYIRGKTNLFCIGTK